MVCAPEQNGLRELRKWLAQLAKWFAPHFESNGRPWENDLRVDLRLVCALICARESEVPVAQRKSFSTSVARQARKEPGERDWRVALSGFSVNRPAAFLAAATSVVVARMAATLPVAPAGATACVHVGH